MTSPDPQQALRDTLARLARAVAHTGEARIRWERAKEEGSPNLFRLAQAHREAEKAGRDLFDKCVDAYCAAAAAGVVTLGESEPTSNERPQCQGAKVHCPVSPTPHQITVRCPKIV
jgi:hypothetical protein